MIAFSLLPESVYLSIWTGSHLQGTSFVDSFARVAFTKEKTIGAAIGTVGGLVSGMKQPR